MNFKKIDKRFIIMEILKWASLLIVFFVIFSSFSEKAVSNEPYDKVLKASLRNADKGEMQEGDNQMIRRLYGLDPASFEEMTLYYPKSNMGSSELFLVKLKSIDQQKIVKNAVESRKETQRKNFDGYGEDQLAMINKSIINISGNYILFISAENSGSVNQDFKDSLKGKKV